MNGSSRARSSASAPTSKKTTGIPGRHREWLVAAALVSACAAIYGQTLSHQFLHLDDDLYVWKNPMVGEGLSLGGAVWAFTTFHAANWHPLTWLSHMLDVQIFGVQPGGAHFTNLLLHAVGSLLLFFVLRSMTGALWPSAFVAGLFAVHPLHVESVAWVAERKDVLSAVFWFAAMGAYARFAREASAAARRPWFFLTCAAFTLGLLAKPMLVTLPLVLLLLDVWPLGRWAPGRPRAGKEVAPASRGAPHDDRPRRPPGSAASAPMTTLITEKAPLFVLSLASGVVTVLAQRSGGAIQQLQNVPISYRVSNALVSYAGYALSLVWPRRLAPYYPFQPEGPDPALALASGIGLVAITILVVRLARRMPFLLVGWLWFVVTLLPVIGIVQIGGQAMADRYTYVPSVGLFVAIAWSAAELAGRWEASRRILATAGALSLAALGLLAWRQTHLWRDSETLFEHTLSVTRDNLVIEYDLGIALGEKGLHDRAAAHFAEAAQVWPVFYDALFHLGVALEAQGKPDEAARAYTRALAVRPDSAEAHGGMGSVLARQGKLDEALVHFREAARIEPGSARAQTNLGLVLLRGGSVDEAVPPLERAVSLDARSAEAQNNLGLARLAQGRVREAAQNFTNALALRPDFEQARANLRATEDSLARGGGG